MMNPIRQITCQVNPELMPVFTVDQPLYAIAKRTQWKWPDEYGEKSRGGPNEHPCKHDTRTRCLFNAGATSGMNIEQISDVGDRVRLRH